MSYGWGIQALAVGSPVEYSPVPGVDCVITPYRISDVASPVFGVIETLHVERSQQVTAGQVVAELNQDVERANVELARFRAGIQSEIKLGRVNMDIDSNRKERIDSLRRQNVISEDQFDEANRESRLSRWELEQARELARVRQLELERALEQLKQKTIRAPFDGFVLDTFKNPGEYVEGQAILRLAQLDPLVVEAIVPMEYFGQVKLGMLAEVVPEVLSGEKLKGKVTVVDRIGDTASNTFGVRLLIDNPENLIPAGLKCVVKFLQQFEEEPADIQASVENVPDTVNPIDRSDPATEIEPVAEETVSRDPENTQNKVADEAANAKDPATDKQVSSYLVLTTQGESNQQTRELIERLHATGIRDLQELDHGPYRGMISLGLYSTRSAAEKRQQSLEELGFTLFFRERD